MKATEKNTRSRDNGSKKGKVKQAQQAPKPKYDKSRTQKNKDRNEAKQKALSNKIIHTPHGTARALKRALQEEEKKKEQEHRHHILDDPRSHYMQLGLIRGVK